MKTAQRIMVLMVLAALAFWLWTVLFPSPEKVIRQQLIHLAQGVSFSAAENNLIKMARAQVVADFFSSNVVVNINVPNHEQQTLASRAEITQAVMVSRQMLSGLEVKMPDINVTVAPDKNSAMADVTVQADVSGEHDAIVQEVKFTFERADRHWLINRVETIRTLQ
jgi:hypothetical protein